MITYPHRLTGCPPIGFCYRPRKAICGSRRTRKIRSYRMDKGEDEQSIMFFMEPADVKDTGFLTYDYDDIDRDDDQWLYLPALKKSKRIASR